MIFVFNILQLFCKHQISHEIYLKYLYVNMHGGMFVILNLVCHTINKL